jgi:hypothetical protein
MRWVSYVEAMVEASEQLNAEVVFAHLPESRLPFVRKFQIWDLRRQLAQRHSTLYTLDQPVHSTVPTPQIATLDQQVS